MALYYVAHRLFAAHDRALAAYLAHRIARIHGPDSVFLPFCDTDEENLVADCKGRRLYELDTQRLDRITAIAAILHGPSLDDGVCMEIGYAAAHGIPTIAMTTDFQNYGPAPDGDQRVLFPDPLLPVILSGSVHAFRLGATTGPHPDRYADFLAQNLATLQDATEQAIQLLEGPLTSTRSFPPPSHDRRIAYLEPSPYGNDERICQVGSRLRTAGWDVHVAGRFVGQDVLAGATRDWKGLSEGSIAVIDVRGPETPPGAAITIGACAATRRPVYALDPNGWWTFAEGREPNYRNLMIQYGLTNTFSRPDQLFDLLGIR